LAEELAAAEDKLRDAAGARDSAAQELAAATKAVDEHQACALPAASTVRAVCARAHS
jgi:hypothetical protein